MTFQAFDKIPRLHKDVIVTEKLDGTNAQIFIYDTLTPVYVRDERTGNLEANPSYLPLLARDHIPWLGSAFSTAGLRVAVGSRKRWIRCDDDNFGFANWVNGHLEELCGLGAGRHYGEWWGQGIGRGYDLTEKRFSLFNVSRWEDVNGENDNLADEVAPACCRVVPILGTGPLDTFVIERHLDMLREYGSIAAPGFKKPEGLVVFHTGAQQLFKKTLDGDGRKGAK